MASPNHCLLTSGMNTQQKELKLKWGPELETNFQTLKAEFAKKPIRAYPLYHTDQPFQVATDFSAIGLGAVLSQEQNDSEKMIAACGRKTTKFEQNYPSTKGELCAFVYALKKFEHILLFKKFIWHTDSGSLKYLQTMKDPKGIWFRWLTWIQQFNFEIRHRPGKENSNADAISRSEHMPPPEPEDEEDEAEYINKLEMYLGELEEEDDIKALNEVGVQLSRENLIREQKEDEILQEVRSWLTKKQMPTKESLQGKREELRAYAQIAEALVIENDLLYFPDNLNQLADKKVYRILIPERCRDAVFHWCHIHNTAGHFGGQSTVLRAKTKFYYPGMNKDLIIRSKICPNCVAKINKARVKDAVHKPARGGYPGEKLYIDLVGPLTETQDHKKYILTLEDQFTRFVQAYPIPNKESATVPQTLLDRYISVFGIPAAIHSDNGKEFTSKLWKELMDRLQIKKVYTPIYNPNSNLVERYHRTLNSMLRVIMHRDDTEWAIYSPTCTLAYNTKVHSSTQMTPYFAMFGRECRLPIDLIIPSPGARTENINEHVKNTLDRFRAIYTYIRKNDLVWYLCPRRVPGKTEKLTDLWLGPYKIKKKPAEVLLTLEPANYAGPQVTVHMGRVVPCKTLEFSKQRIPTRLATSAAADELGEEIRPPQSDDSALDVRVPVQVPQPTYEIRDLPRERRVIVTKEVTTSANQTDLEP